MTDQERAKEIVGCPATFGREAADHAWVTVTRSSYRPVPYQMCSKCGLITQGEGEKR